MRSSTSIKENNKPNTSSYQNNEKRKGGGSSDILCSFFHTAKLPSIVPTMLPLGVDTSMRGTSAAAIAITITTLQNNSDDNKTIDLEGLFTTVRDSMTLILMRMTTTMRGEMNLD